MSKNQDDPHPLKNVPIYTAVHPERLPYFRQIAAPKKIIKEGRSNIFVACSQCRKMEGEGVNLQKCARCKIAWYCSKECQRKQWPIHKHLCKGATANAPKLISSFMVNPTLGHILQLAIINEFKLVETPILDRPFIARCDVSIQPSDPTIPLRLRLGQIDKKDLTSLEGLLYIKSLVPLDAKSAIDMTRMELWINMKKKNAECFPNSSVGLIDFHIDNSVQSITCGIVIRDEAIDLMKAGAGFQCESALLPGKTFVPLTRDGCIDFINTHIRSDKRNQLGLRTQITKEQIDKIASG